MSNPHGALWEREICAIYGATHIDLGLSAMLRPAPELFSGAELDGAPAVLVLDGSLLAHQDELRRLPRHVVIVAADATAEARLGVRADLSFVGLPSGEPQRRMLRAACELA